MRRVGVIGSGDGPANPAAAAALRAAPGLTGRRSPLPYFRHGSQSRRYRNISFGGVRELRGVRRKRFDCKSGGGGMGGGHGDFGGGGFHGGGFAGGSLTRA